MSIDITSWGHSAVRFERDGQRLVVDPGVLSSQEIMESANAVLVTHEHTDHFALQALAAAYQANKDLQIWGTSSVAAQLAEAGLPETSVNVATVGDEFSAAGFSVKALGGDHATIYPGFPHADNVGYLIEDTILHPGDAFTAVPEDTKIKVLFLPISAPWLKLADTIDYLKAVKPEVTLPIHDAVLSDPGKALTDQVLGALAGETKYQRLSGGEVVTVE